MHFLLFPGTSDPCSSIQLSSFPNYQFVRWNNNNWLEILYLSNNSKSFSISPLSALTLENLGFQIPGSSLGSVQRIKVRKIWKCEQNICIHHVLPRSRMPGHFRSSSVKYGSGNGAITKLDEKNKIHSLSINLPENQVKITCIRPSFHPWIQNENWISFVNLICKTGFCFQFYLLQKCL